MIVFLRGTVFSNGPTYVDMDVQGVGYRIWVTERLALRSEKHTELFVYTYQHVREDAISLFGFETELERTLFELLLSVSGVGPKGAMQIVNATTARDFTYAIRSEDLHALCNLPGIGKKTAQRLIVELKDKLDNVWFPDTQIADMPQPVLVKTQEESGLQDVIEALKMLGYPERQAADTARMVLAGSPDVSVETALKLCLQELYQQSSIRR